MIVLICNAGSTSLKFKLYRMPEEKVIAAGGVERVGSEKDAIFKYKNNDYSVYLDNCDIPSYKSGISLFLTYLTSGEGKALDIIEEIEAVGYKTVLAKGYYGVHELNSDVLDGMREYLPLAPIHNSAYLSSISAMKEVLPKAKMIGAFETDFHRTIPEERRMYGIPYEWYEKYGLIRLGFHGASHSYIASVLSKEKRAYKAVSCHLGGSGSVCALLNGRSVDTSFGISLESGLIHSSRVGDMDPRVVFYLLDQGLTREEIEKGLTKDGGIKGLSGVSGDMRYVEEEAKKGNKRAIMAIDVYVRGIINYIASFATEMKGLTDIVFTAGIGEHSPYVRKKVVEGLSIFGLKLDKEKNDNNSYLISEEDSPITIRVIPTDEEVVVSRKVYEYCSNENKEGRENESRNS